MEYRRVNAAEGFGRSLLDMNQRIKSIESAPAGTIGIRESIIATDPDTGVSTILGILPDGTTGFQPFIDDIVPPPIPSVPFASSSPGVFIVTWDGAFADGSLAPSDFQFCNIYGHDIANPAVTILIGTVRSPQDSAIYGDAVAGSSWVFWATSLDYNRNESVSSVVTAPITLASVVDTSGLQSQLNANSQAVSAAQAAIATKNSIWLQATSPSSSGNRIGDTWFDTSHGNKPMSWNGTTWVSAQDASISAALSAANGKNTIISAANAPATAGHIVGDVWFDTSSGNKPNTFNGTTWVSVQDTSISAAATAASAAQTAANGKNSITYSTLVASGSGSTTGDIWLQTNASNVVIGQWQWSGSAWIQQTVDSAVIASLDAGKIIAHTITATQIAVGAITAQALSANSVSATAMVANTITAGQIAAGAITATTLAANAVTASAIAGQSITAVQLAANSITASAMAANSVTANALSANSVTASAIAASSVTASAMVAGTITAQSGIIADINADKIQSGTINASHVSIGAGTNALADPGFLSTDITNARTAQSTGGTAGWTVANGTATGYRTAVRNTTTTSGQFSYLTLPHTFANAGQLIPCSAGQVWNLKVDTTTSAAANISFQVNTAKADGTVSITTLTTTSLSSVGQRSITASYVVPAGVTGFLPGLICDTSGITWTVHGNAFVGQQVTGDLLVNGAINGMTITGATIQSAASGARMVFDQNAFNAWNTAGDNYFTVSDAAGVNISSKGQAGYDTTRTNWCSNPSFEIDTSYWSSTQTVTRDTTQKQVGTASMKVTHTATADRVATYTDAIVNTRGPYAQMSAYILHNSATVKNVTAKFTWTDYNNVNTGGWPVTTGTTVSVPANTWTRVSVSVPSAFPADASRIRVDFTGTAFTSAETLWIDSALLEYVDTSGMPISAYFDGNSASVGGTYYVWQGQAQGLNNITPSDELTPRNVKIKTGANAVIDNVGHLSTAPGVGFIYPTPYTQTAGLYSDGRVTSVVEGTNSGNGSRLDVGRGEASLVSDGDIALRADLGIVVETPTVTVNADQLDLSGAMTIGGKLTVGSVSMDPAYASHTQFTWSNSWSHFGSGYGNFQVKEIVPGVVLMQGMAKAGTKTDGVVIGILPIALRPVRIQNIGIVVRTTIASPNTDQPGLLSVNPNGNVALFCNNIASASYATLSLTYFIDSP